MLAFHCLVISGVSLSCCLYLELVAPVACVLLSGPVLVTGEKMVISFPTWTFKEQIKAMDLAEEMLTFR